MGFLDETGLARLWNRITTVFAEKSSLSGYVLKDGDKVLSTNDYTTAEKEKLAGLSNYNDSALSGRVTTVEGLLDSHTVRKDVPSDALFTDTKYTGNAPINVSGTTINHNASGVSSGNYGQSSNVTDSSGNATVNIPYITVDDKGHITGISNKTLKTAPFHTYTVAWDLTNKAITFVDSATGTTQRLYLTGV